MDRPPPSPISRILSVLIGGSEQFRRNFLHLASANALAQLIGVLALPLLTRLFSPQDFGILAVYTATQSVLLAVVTGRFEWAVPSARHPSEAARLIGLGLVATGLTTAIVGGAIAWDGAAIAARLGLSETHRNLLWLLPLGVLAGGIQLLLESWHVFQAVMTPVSRAKLLQSVGTILTSVIAGALSAGALGLVAGYVLGFVLAGPVLARGQGQLFLRLKHLNLASLGAAFGLHWRDTAASLALSIVNVAMAMSMTFLLTTYYDATTVGWYGLVFRAATAPIGLFTTAIVHSFWADAATLAKSDPAKLRRFFLQSVGRLAIFSLPVAAVCLAGPWYIGPIFGAAQWSGAGVLLAAVTPYLVGIIIFGPNTHMIVYGRQHWQLGCDLLTLIIASVLFGLSARLGYAAWVAVLAASAALFCGYLLRFALHLRANKLHARIPAPPTA